MGVALLLMAWIISIGAHELPGRGESQTNVVLIDPYPAFRAIAILLIVIGAGSLILLVALRPGSRRSTKERRSRAISLAVAFALIVFAGPELLDLIERLSESVDPVNPASVTEAEPVNTEVVAEQSDGSGQSAWILALAAGAGVLLLVAIGTSRRRIESPGPETEREPTHLSITLEGVLEELNLSDDPKEVIIGAYARMEQALAKDGLPRLQTEAPMEYLERALTRLNISRISVQRLTDLFTVARFSDHAMGRDMAIEAVSALNEILREVQPA